MGPWGLRTLRPPGRGLLGGTRNAGDESASAVLTRGFAAGGLGVYGPPAPGRVPYGVPRVLAESATLSVVGAGRARVARSPGVGRTLGTHAWAT